MTAFDGAALELTKLEAQSLTELLTEVADDSTG